jgi:hypothetical protein
LGTDPFFDTVNGKITLDESTAVKIYSAATKIDSAPGSYPPTDTGSDGVSVAQAAKNLGLISGYTHTFNFDDALKALSSQPVIIGINWYSNFFHPKAGVIKTFPGDTVAGGHEIVLDEIDMSRNLVGGTNSWGPGWGDGGRFYIDFDLFRRLLSEQGDVTAFVPLTQPAPIPVPPTPTPTPSPVPAGDPDATLWNQVSPWTLKNHTGSTKAVSNELKAWAKAKGLV